MKSGDSINVNILKCEDGYVITFDPGSGRKKVYLATDDVSPGNRIDAVLAAARMTPEPERPTPTKRASTTRSSATPSSTVAELRQFLGIDPESV